MMTSESMKFGADVCRLLGLDPSDLYSLTIYISDGGQHVAVKIEGVVKQSNLPGLAKLIGEYELAPKGWRDIGEYELAPKGWREALNR